MELVDVIKKGYECERCKHKWVPNNLKIKPICCPNCHSPYWYIPKKKEKKK